MTREEFIREADIILEDWPGYDVIPCSCDDPCCPKWKFERVVNKEN